MLARLQLKVIGAQIMDIIGGDPKGDMRRRLQTGCARCYVLATDRPLSSCENLIALTEAPTETYRWHSPYCWRIPEAWRVPLVAPRKAVLKRIEQGGLGIDEKLGPWNGSFWLGLKISGAIRRGPGTEWIIWEKTHQELIADLETMPLMHKLEKKSATHGQRRLRRCYASYLPPEDHTGSSTLAGLLAGSVLRDAGGETWLELPDGDTVRAVLGDWGIPFVPRKRPTGRRIIHVSPLFGQLVMHLMPPRSFERMRSITKAGDCPYLSVVLWQMALTRKNGRYMPFPEALPFGVSKATFFRRGWRRRDLNKVGWLDLGIRIAPKFRQLLVDWYDRKNRERQPRPSGSLTA